ncbi:nucleoside-diphosphate-sugar epimerase [Pontibacter ummariensis]|uniref:Nucleoside-diphosphate-sugar epimerase n=1 Tax=Pontibacter ummariensis TaxID=1610492 RepID=A0A239E0Y4_9BACT|nr:NAD-dependent epimerase/dehydratase family protein [Pontibacter ummariensis]PRY13653.1 nucleoside-diphosphate-sugar epimerase [Pontibacter ummariensis]SNS38267.1 Nucleoside-diphosphate-sugar epimerase [Pontibacter ummariensis]
MTTNAFRFLVLGGTGSIGYAFTQELLQHQEHVTLLVRDKQKADNLFGQHPTLHLVEGDAQDGELLKRLGAEATHIFHGVNYPYEQWQNNMERVTQNVTAAAAINKSTIFFPGNIYNFGQIDVITEKTPPKPGTKKGAIRVKLEQMLQGAAEQGKCRVINLRMPDFWGPNVMNEGIAPIFKGALAGKPMPWLIRNDIPHQLVYTPDAARVFYRLAKLTPQEPYAVYNFAGEVVPSIKQWQAQIAAAAGTPPKYRLYPGWLFKLMGLFSPSMREISEMGYLWQNTILLNDDKLRQALPDLRLTPMKRAIADTLEWFKENVQ